MPEKKEKVLIVHNYYQVPGGEDTVVENERRLLEDNGHDVVLYTRHNSELKNMSKLQKLLLPFSTIFNWRTYREVRCIIMEQKIDIVHVHNTLNLVSPSVYYAAFSKKVPVVQTIHNFRLLCPGATLFRDGHVCEDCLREGLACAVKHKCYRSSRLQTLACVISTVIHRILGTYGKLNYICLTEFNKEKLLNLKKIRGENVYVKPNFVAACDEKEINSKRKKQIVYVGRLDKLKGVDFLLEAWNKQKNLDLRLIICGIGPLEDWCREYIANHNLKNVEMRGFVSNSDVKKMLRESMALVLPTQWYEGFPMTILEAFSVGTPVLGSNIGNVGKLITDGVNGRHFSPDNKEELLDAIRNLNIDYKTVYKYFEQNYSAKSNYEALKDIYTRVSK